MSLVREVVLLLVLNDEARFLFDVRQQNLEISIKNLANLVILAKRGYNYCCRVPNGLFSSSSESVALDENSVKPHRMNSSEK